MAEFPALPLWTDALLGDTTHLTTLEFGAYMKLLIASWRTPKCDLPFDDKLIARYAGLSPAQWKGMRSIILKFFIKKWRFGEWRLHQKRLRKERKYVLQRSIVQSKRAKARWLKNNKTRNAGAMPGACHPTPTPSIKEKPSYEGSKKGQHDEAGRSQNSNAGRQGSGAAANQPPLAEAKPAKPDKRRMPDTARLPDEWLEYARAAGASDQEARELAADFVGYWSDRTDTKASKSDRGWERTWRTHIKDVAARWKWSSRSERRPGRISTVQAGDEAAEAVVESLRRRGQLAPDDRMDADEAQPRGRGDQGRDFQSLDDGTDKGPGFTCSDTSQAHTGELLIFPKLEGILR